MSDSLKVRQIRNDFFKPTFLPKNEQTNLTFLLVDLFLFVFWKKVKTTKRHFKINWPLVTVKSTVGISQTFVTFSEYMNFIVLLKNFFEERYIVEQTKFSRNSVFILCKIRLEQCLNFYSIMPWKTLNDRAQELKKEQLVESRTALSHCQSNITAYSYKTFFKTRR